MNGKRTKSAALVCLAATVALFSATRPALAQDGQDFIVTFRAGVTPAGHGNAAANAGGTVRRSFNGVNAASVRVPNAAALARLTADPSVLSVVPNREVFAFQGKGKPGGGGGSSQVVPAGVTRVGVPTAGSNGDGIGVAILDTGVDLAHADLTGTVNAFSAFGGSCQDNAGHGTHVAGTVAARDNTVGVIGVAPKAGLYCVKVLDGNGSGTDETLMAGLDWVLDSHDTVVPNIRVVNMSLGRPGTAGDNGALHDLIVALEAAGVAVVVSAGNDATAEVSEMVPASYAEVISVASTTAKAGTNQCRNLAAPIAADTASYFTTDGVGVTVSAPGEDAEDVNRGCFIQSVGILSTRLGGGTTRMSGTSMAAPHVTGIVARYFQVNPNYTVADVRQFIQTDSVRRGTAPLNSPTSTYTFDGEREGIAQAP
jgi:subtilisin family serine protease